MEGNKSNKNNNKNNNQSNNKNNNDIGNNKSINKNNIKSSNEINENDPNSGKINISFSDVNYAIYKIGKWKNTYKINLIGTSNEIPATEVTKKHVLSNINEIRNSKFELGENEVNGIVALSIQLNPELQGIDIAQIIADEEIEYKNIVDEIDGLELEDPNDFIELENNKFLIYKLEKDHHVTVAKPANGLTMKHHAEEIQRLKELNK
jgi:hypothetical protein